MIQPSHLESSLAPQARGFAFYFFFRVDNFFDGKMNSALQFCEQLLAQQGVALVPGEAFGDNRWVRLSFASSEKELTRALARVSAFAEVLAVRST